MGRMLKYIASVLLLLMMAGNVMALSLDEAKQKGLVGEQPDGYLGIKEPSSEVSNLVEDINRKRKEKYQQVAAKSGTALKTVEALAGEKAIQNTRPGQYIRLPNGQWAIRR